MSPIPPPPPENGGGGGTPDPGSVGPTELQDDAVTNPKLAPDAVTGDKIQDQSVGTNDLADGAVTSSKIGAGEVTLGNMAASSVGAPQIIDGNVSTPKLVDGAVTSQKIAPAVIATITAAQSSASAAQSAADAAQSDIDAHEADATDAHLGTAIGNTPSGNVAATTVQAAINELDVEKAPTGSVTTVQTNLDTHINNTTGAHAGTAISNTPSGNIAATTSQAAINELDAEKATTGSVTTVQTNLTTHVNNTTGAHAGTAIANTPAGNVAATTVQAAINELDTEKLATTQVGVAGGAASLDGGGKVPASQLPASVMEIKGEWNASTNSPTLADGVGNAGDLYRVSVAGTQNLGSGSQAFEVNDTVWYAADNVWHRSDNSDAVTSVNAQTGAVALVATNIPSTATGDVAATNVQSAIAELASEKATTGSVATVQTNLDTHINNTTGAHAGTAVSNIPAGNIAATNVQSALNELDSEKATTGSVTSVQTNLTTHINNTTDAHDASAISILDTANDFTATDVEGALAELQSDSEADEAALAAHIANATAAHAGTAISNIPAGNIAATTVQAALNELDSEKATTGSVTTVQTNLTTHINNATGAHAGTAISNTPAGNIAATTVQAALNELDSEKATTGSVTTVQSNLDAHINNTTGAHAGTAIANTPAGNIAATTVQAALNELDSEKGSLAGTNTWAGVNTFQAGIRDAVQAMTATGNISATGGRVVTFNGAAGQTLTLPAAVQGMEFEIWNIDSADNVTIARNGSDTITAYQAAAITSFVLPFGTKIKFVAMANNAWRIEPFVTLSATGSGSIGSTTSIAVSGVSLSLGPGVWKIFAKGHFDFSTGTPRSYQARLQNITAVATLDAANGNISNSNGQVPFALMAHIALTATSTIRMEGSVSAVDGSQLVQNGWIIAEAA